MHRAIWSSLVLIVLTTGAALAQPAMPAHTEPRYYRVADVASDDVLNVRAEPDAGAEIVGTLAPEASPVEVVHVEGDWAYVSGGERMGWAHTAYLEPIQMSPVDDSTLPAGMQCSGTEPFWGLDISRKAVNFSAIDSDEREMDLVEAGGFSGVGPVVSYFVASDAEGEMTAIVNNQMCSDGMSDRDYPRRIDLVLNGSDGRTGLTGCCHVPVN